MRRREFLGAGAAVIVAPLALPRPANAQSASTLHFVPSSDLAIIDPIWTLAYVTRTHGFMVFDTLYGLDENFEPQPQMVAGHVVENDGKLWKLTLRDGLVFHDGSSVLASDCVASIGRWASVDAFGQALMAATDELSAPDDKHIRFRLKRPFPLLPMALAKGSPFMCAMMPARLASTPASTQITEMTGSGPFRFVAGERVPGSLAVYSRFDRYVPAPGASSFLAGAKKVHFDRVEWHTLPDPGTAAAALQAGEVDWLETPSFDLAPVLRGNTNVVTRAVDPTGTIGVLRFNHLNPPFDNPAIRRALLSAIDQKACMTAITGDDTSLYRADVGFFTPDTPMATAADIEAMTAPRDFAKAKHALAAAGYKGEKVVVLAASNIEPIHLMSLVVQDTLTRLGMNVDFVSTDWGTVMQRRTSTQPIDRGGWNCFIGQWSGSDLANPAVSISLRGDGKAAGGWLTSPEIERLRTAWFEASDLEAQRAVCRDLQLQAWKDVPYIPLGQFRPMAAWRSRITGISDGFPLFWNVRPA